MTMKKYILMTVLLALTGTAALATKAEENSINTRTTFTQPVEKEGGQAVTTGRADAKRPGKWDRG